MSPTRSRDWETSSETLCRPAYATARTGERKTYGPRVGQVSVKLGAPFMPWQSLVSDVALEVDEATGLLAYREIIITVPRQSGKTTLDLALSIHRCLATNWRRACAEQHKIPVAQRVVYTAQTRLDARKKWEDDQLPILKRSPFGPPVNEGGNYYRERKTTGQEACLWYNGASYGIMATTEKSGHGPTVDIGHIDEAFAQEDDRLEQAFKPSMITRPQPQLWITSTAGTEKSVFLRGKVEAGRALVTAGVNTGTAYFEFAAPLDADPADPATWLACMPAVCPKPPCHCDPEGKWRHTTTVAAIAAEYQSFTAAGNLNGFRRAYLNQWVDAIPDEWLVIARDLWMGLEASPVAHGEVAIAADVSPASRWGVIAAAWRRPDGHMDVEIIDRRAGTAWMPAKLAELARNFRPAGADGKHFIIIDPAGPAGSIIDPTEKLGVVVYKTSAREMAHAAQRFFDMVTGSRDLRHASDPILNAAVAGAIRRDLGDGWAWARKGAAVDICPLVAVTLAVWAHDKFAKRQAPYDLLRSVA